jgi:hypothetical protein
MALQAGINIGEAQILNPVVSKPQEESFYDFAVKQGQAKMMADKERQKRERSIVDSAKYNVKDYYVKDQPVLTALTKELENNIRTWQNEGTLEDHQMDINNQVQKLNQFFVVSGAKKKAIQRVASEYDKIKANNWLEATDEGLLTDIDKYSDGNYNFSNFDEWVGKQGELEQRASIFSADKRFDQLKFDRDMSALTDALARKGEDTEYADTYDQNGNLIGYRKSQYKGKELEKTLGQIFNSDKAMMRYYNREFDKLDDAEKTKYKGLQDFFIQTNKDKFDVDKIEQKIKGQAGGLDFNFGSGGGSVVSNSDIIIQKFPAKKDASQLAKSMPLAFQGTEGMSKEEIADKAMAGIIAEEIRNKSNGGSFNDDKIVSTLQEYGEGYTVQSKKGKSPEEKIIKEVFFIPLEGGEEKVGELIKVYNLGGKDYAVINEKINTKSGVQSINKVAEYGNTNLGSKIDIKNGSTPKNIFDNTKPKTGGVKKKATSENINKGQAPRVLTPQQIDEGYATATEKGYNGSIEDYNQLLIDKGYEISA